MPRKAVPIKRDEILNQKELAARLDLDPRQIRNLSKRGMPTTYLGESGEERGYAWPACLHWYLRFKVDAETQKFTTPQRLQAAQIRDLEAKAAKSEMALSHLRGELLERPLVSRERQQAFERIRNLGSTRASRWAPRLEGLAGTHLLTMLEDLGEEEMRQLQQSLLSIPTYEEALRHVIEQSDTSETGDDDDDRTAAA